MKSVSALLAMTFAMVTALAGCASDGTESGASGSVAVNLIIGNTDVTAVDFDVVCESGITLSGQFNVNDEEDPPIFATIMDLPPGDCTIALTAFDDAGEALCTGSEDFTVIADETVSVNIVLTCVGDGIDPLGNVNISATFEEVEGNSCPRLHFLNAVPDEVPAEGSAVTVLVSDKNGDALTTALTATGGSFADPSAQSTTYTCDNANGSQTISVTVSDGDVACDKSKSFEVTCPGVNLCEGVTCDDDGNVCTDVACNPANGLCETSNNTNECTAGGSGGDLAVNGGFETGNLDGWTPFCDGLGTCEATTAEANTGSWSGLVLTSGAPANPLIKQANVGIGIVQPNSEITIRFSLKGSLAGASGVVFAELFSEIVPEGVSKAEILGGAPLFPTDQWVDYEFTTTTGPDVSNGVTLQLAAICGAVEGCVVEAYFDDVSIVIPGGAGEPGTCSEGICVPNPECSTAADCPDDGNECTDALCDAGTCGSSNNTNVCDGGAGTCDGAGVCVPNAECAVPGDCTDDGNECTDPVCNAGVCDTSNNTNPCDGGAGICGEGQCVPNALALYSQDFEPPMDPAAGDALILDTAAETPLGPWLFFANVFDGGGNLKFNFGPFGAPNATVSPSDTFISAVVTGEGDAPQGDQQLSVFSDYNCCDRDPITGELRQGHGNGTDLVEISVFQELNPIPNSLIGQRLTFSFDAKAGNIEGATTAVAYIQTLDPSTGFSQTNFVPVEMTSIPATWNRYEAVLDLTDPLLEGQILQIGFRSVASDFQGSGIFYDNVDASLTSAP